VVAPFQKESKQITNIFCAMNIKNVMKGLKVFYPKPDWSKPRLVSISISHYSEKSRWVLDLSPLKNVYYEEMHCPAMHLTTTLVELAKVPRVQTWPIDSFFQQELDNRQSQKVARSKNLTAVPKLVLPKSFLLEHNITCPPDATAGVVAGHSSGIIKLLTDIFPSELGHLYPSGLHEKEVVEVEAFLDSTLGVAATTWSFGNMVLVGEKFYSQQPSRGGVTPSNLNEKAVDFMLSSIVQADIPSIEKKMFGLFGKKAVPFMIKFNNVSAASRDEAKTQISDAFASMDKLLAKNNPSYSTDHSFLLGTDKMTAADIALASLAIAVLMPMKASPFFASLDKYSVFTEKDAPGCVAMFQFANTLLEMHPSARYAMELYVKHRPEINIRKM
jgi:hypothetical protein